MIIGQGQNDNATRKTAQITKTRFDQGANLKNFPNRLENNQFKPGEISKETNKTQLKELGDVVELIFGVLGRFCVLVVFDDFRIF